MRYIVNNTTGSVERDQEKNLKTDRLNTEAVVPIIIKEKIKKMMNENKENNKYRTLIFNFIFAIISFSFSCGLTLLHCVHYIFLLLHIL